METRSNWGSAAFLSPSVWGVGDSAILVGARKQVLPVSGATLVSCWSQACRSVPLTSHPVGVCVRSFRVLLRRSWQATVLAGRGTSLLSSRSVRSFTLDEVGTSSLYIVYIGTRKSQVIRNAKDAKECMF